MTAALAERLVPARLGTSFRWLLASSWTSNLGDGIVLSAGPLLVASQTDDARLVALAALLQQLPWLLFGLWAGAVVDRVDRRVLVVGVDLARAVVVAVLAGTVLTGTVSIGVVLATVFLLGTSEVFADTASGALLPMVVQRDDLGPANARLQAGFFGLNQLAGPPLGAVLFTAGAAWPFAAEAVLVSLAALLVARTRVTPLPAAEPSRLWHDVLDGVRWTVRHPAVRTLVLTIATFNVTFGATWAVLVLYAQQRLGLGPVGYGLLTTTAALGGLLGTALYGRITALLSLSQVMRVGLVLETLTHVALAVTTSPAVAVVVLFVFGAHGAVWHTTSVTIRQRAVPQRLQGRVGSVNALGVYGGLVVGAAIGGLLAESHGITAPFWFAFVGSALFVVVIWGQLRHLAHGEPAVA